MDTAPSSVPAIGVVGLGPLGAAVADRLRVRGRAPHVHDPATRTTRSYVVHGGAGGIASIAALARLSDLVLLATEDDATTEEAVLGPVGLAGEVRPGTLVVDMASIDPALTGRIARALAAAGAALVDAAPVGTAADAGAGTLTLLCSGAADDLARARPVLDDLAPTLVHVGAVPGAAHAARALARLYGAVNLAAATEALAIGRRFGLEPGAVLATIDATSAIGGTPPPTLAHELLPARFASGYRLDQLMRDMDAGLATAQREGVPAPLSRLVREIVAAARVTAPAAQDHTEIVRWFETNTGTTLATAAPVRAPEQAGPVPIRMRS
ncbi:MAG TPA: NAD(P)-binding domain-containing protein [Hyphomicrobiales bacterium]|nr:NAD(P)-binding domain-containing protein [Hyphomicrobiales bacterium]